MNPLAEIKKNVKHILAGLPKHVTLVAAAKTRRPEEIKAAVESGVRHLGHNYVQEAAAMRDALKDWEASLEEKPSWHLIGHLQRNKAKNAINLFDVIETIDSVRLAKELEKRLARKQQHMEVLIEVNSGKESAKTGVPPKEVKEPGRQVGAHQHIFVCGLMTMGPAFGDPENARPYFRLTKALFDELAAADLPGVQMRHLSMGMSNSFKQAIEEGANIVRIGTRLFGARPQRD